jgi:hypothetical protein
MIAAYLSAHPRTAVSAEEVEARAADPLSEPPVEWAALIPALRERTGTTRTALSGRLAAELGHPGATEQVGDYVHGLETGGLEPRRVKPAVVAALSRIFAVPEALLELGRRPGPAISHPRRAMVFGRDAPVAAAADAPPSAPAPAREEEIDDLFTGGDG